MGASTCAFIIVKCLSVGTALWLIWADTLACNFIKFLIVRAYGSRLWAFTLACIWIESLSRRTSEYTGTSTSAFFIIKYLSIGTALWCIGTITFACNSIKFLIVGTCGSWIWALTLTCLWIESLSTRASNNLWAATFTGIVIKGLYVRASCWSIFADTFTCCVIKLLSIGTLLSWFSTFTLARIWIKFLPTGAANDFRTVAFACIIVKNLSVRTFFRSIRADTLACNIVKFLTTSALLPRLRTFTFTRSWIKLLSTRACKYLWACTSTGFQIEDLCRIGTVMTPSGAFTFTGVVVEYQWSCTWLDCWTLTLASFLVENLWFGTVMLFEANAITFSVAKNLPTWAVLDAGADAFAVAIAILEW